MRPETNRIREESSLMNPPESTHRHASRLRVGRKRWLAIVPAVLMVSGLGCYRSGRPDVRSGLPYGEKVEVLYQRRDTSEPKTSKPHDVVFVDGIGPLEVM